MQCHPASRTGLAEVRQHFLRYAPAGGGSGQYVAVARAADGKPSLLSRAAFGALCDRLAAPPDPDGPDAQPPPATLQVRWGVAPGADEHAPGLAMISFCVGRRGGGWK